MSGLKGAECRKFQANIFNKSKCTNCFKQREEHSPEALESNRASRKVSKCGYLFVAPDWDFTIPLNRTKRWQRRWFVLYDDGELTYSLDDHPATIPQGVVDMNRVLEVSCAEEVTGNQFSLAITAPDRVTFIKATCKEEAKWWMDVLSVFPCTLKQQGRHKRNATFPGIKTTTTKQTRHTAATMAPTAFETAAGQRVRFHSCTTDPMIESRPQSAPAPTLEAEEDVFPTKDSSSSPPASSTLQSSTHSSTNTSRCFSTPISTSTPLSSLPPSSTPFSSLPPSSARLLREEQKENTPYIGDYTDNPPTSESPPTQDKMSHKLRARRAPRRTEGRGVGLTQPRSKSEVSGMFHPTQNYPLARNQPSTTSTVVAAAAATVTTSNTASGALTGCSAPLATTNLRADGDTNSNPYPAGGLPSSVPHSAGRVPHSHSSSAGGALHPPSQSLRRQSLPSPSHVPTNICIPSSLPPTSLHSAQESSKSTISSSCGSIASSSFPSTSGATMTYSPNSSSFSSPTTRQVASSLHPSSPTTANPLKPFFKQSRGRRRATIDVASSLSSLTSFPSFATPPSLTTASSSSSSSSTPFFPPLGLNSYSTSYLASYKRGGLGGTATPPLLSHSLSSSTLGLAMHAPLPSRPLPRASTPPARPGVWANKQICITCRQS